MEPRLTDELYALYRDLLLERSGLFYPEHKRDDLEHGLQLALKATPLTNLAELYSDARSNTTIWETILAHLTIGETSFFRNRPQFEALRSEIFPDLFRRRSTLRNMRIWSAGCATGEEPYSVAMLLTELLPPPSDWHINILATDINPNFLARAREGLYGNWSFRDTPDDIKTRFFTEEKNRWRLLPHIRAMVTFARINLTESTYPSITNGTTALDIILCRNVTIYFNEATTRAVVDRFYRALAPGGWLVVGHAEPQASTYHQFEVYNFPNTVIYRKSLNAPFFISDQFSSFPAAPSSAPSSPAATCPPTSANSPQKPGEQGTTTQQQSSINLPARPFFPISPPALPPSFPPVSPYPPASTGVSSPPPPVQKPPVQKPPAQKPPPAPNARALWEQASLRLSQNDKATAEKLIDQLLLVEPDHPEALAAMGRMCADRGEWECAKRYCNKVLEVNPLQIEAHYILAQVYEHEDDLDAALTEYRRVVFLDRQFVLGMIGMANIWRRMGRADDARRSYRNVLKQLSTFTPLTPVPGAEGATASELVAFVARQLQKLD